ncbi:MAG TPA: hypothetical protein VFN02_15700 [Ktedonobacteraceae bacterium]|nr:hypothetical protein [Ktedonobacteraceae bacterium]
MILLHFTTSPISSFSQTPEQVYEKVVATGRRDPIYRVRGDGVPTGGLGVVQ